MKVIFFYATCQSWPNNNNFSKSSMAKTQNEWNIITSSKDAMRNIGNISAVPQTYQISLLGRMKHTIVFHVNILFEGHAAPKPFQKLRLMLKSNLPWSQLSWNPFIWKLFKVNNNFWLRYSVLTAMQENLKNSLHLQVWGMHNI